MQKEDWHLSKAIPISFIMALILQFIALVVYMSNMNNDIIVNAKEIARHEIEIYELQKSATEQAIMMARMDENLQAIRDMVETIVKK
jgi:hypothetical protein